VSVSHPNNTAAKQEETTHYETKAPPNLHSLPAKNQKGWGAVGEEARFIGYYPATPKSPCLENRKEEQKQKGASPAPTPS
jgi:hypothetical protein